MRGFVLSDGNPALLEPYAQGLAGRGRDVAAIRAYLAPATTR